MYFIFVFVTVKAQIFLLQYIFFSNLPLSVQSLSLVKVEHSPLCMFEVTPFSVAQNYLGFMYALNLAFSKVIFAILNYLSSLSLAISRLTCVPKNKLSCMIMLLRLF